MTKTTKTKLKNKQKRRKLNRDRIYYDEANNIMYIHPELWRELITIKPLLYPIQEQT